MSHTERTASRSCRDRHSRTAPSVSCSAWMSPKMPKRRSFTGGHRFLDDLAREVLADETELAHVAAQASAPPPSVSPAEGDGED